MRLGGWWKGSDTDSDQSPSASSPKLLEDLPPAFDDPIDEKPAASELYGAQVKQVASQIGLEDFKTASSIPCLSKAMFTGIALGVTTGSAMYIWKRQPRKAINWTFGGFVAGSVVLWEKCRYTNYQKRLSQHRAQIEFKQLKGASEK